MGKIVSAKGQGHRRSETMILSKEESQKNVSSWEDFENEVRATRKKLCRTRSGTEPHLLFRGQENSAWQLETTLERAGHDRMLFSDYYRTIAAVRPQIETLVGAVWEKMPGYDEVREWMAKPGVFSVDIMNLRGFSANDYMVYLRHHGFPSPLLDWTRSPFVASYFAFRQSIKHVRRASIYVYCEHPNQRKRLSRYEPVIISHGPNVRSHRRHVLQQCEYTSCLAFKSPMRFVQHEEVFARSGRGQDFLWKFNIPSSERVKVLRSLDAHNLNAFSLFGSEESLMETLALRELEF